jgi:hypothetical protein
VPARRQPLQGPCACPHGPTACSSHDSRVRLSASRAGQTTAAVPLKACPAAADASGIPVIDRNEAPWSVDEDPGRDFWP